MNENEKLNEEIEEKEYNDNIEAIKSNFRKMAKCDEELKRIIEENKDN